MSPDIVKCSFGDKIILMENKCDNSYIAQKEETFEVVQLSLFYR